MKRFGRAINRGVNTKLVNFQTLYCACKSVEMSWHYEINDEPRFFMNFWLILLKKDSMNVGTDLTYRWESTATFSECYMSIPFCSFCLKFLNKLQEILRLLYVWCSFSMKFISHDLGNNKKLSNVSSILSAYLYIFNEAKNHNMRLSFPKFYTWLLKHMSNSFQRS